MEEETVAIVTAYICGGRGSLVVAIPKEAREKLSLAKGQKLLVKVDSKGRLIFEPVKPLMGKERVEE